MRNGAAIAAAILLLSGMALAQQGKKVVRKPIKDVMERTHKEKDALVFKVRDGESSDEENKKLLAEYKSLLDMKPPLGDAGAWKNRVNNAIAAIQDVVDKKAGAVEKMRGATDCKACHEAHRVGGNK